MKNAKTVVGRFKREYKKTQSRTGDSHQDGESVGVGDKMDVLITTWMRLLRGSRGILEAHLQLASK